MPHLSVQQISDALTGDRDHMVTMAVEGPCQAQHELSSSYKWRLAVLPPVISLLSENRLTDLEHDCKLKAGENDDYEKNT
jgi:hypothetical protein